MQFMELADIWRSNCLGLYISSDVFTHVKMYSIQRDANRAIKITTILWILHLYARHGFGCFTYITSFIFSISVVIPIIFQMQKIKLKFTWSLQTGFVPRTLRLPRCSVATELHCLTSAKDPASLSQLTYFDNSLFGRSALCIIGCLSASLASTSRC
jgi:hypothetical protein